jgi:hypothetical protein
LPEGIHDCDPAEIKARFGSFQGSDRRPQLFARLEGFVAEVRAAGLVRAILVDGSFVTDKPEPNDIDLVLIVDAGHDFAADLPLHQYNVLAQQRVRRRFGFDIVVVKNGSDNLTEAVAFFTQVRQRPGAKKGLLRLKV